jgi:AcrR family transcriptional regulator
MNVARVKQTRRSGREIQALILNAARELFADRGYHKTTTREIALAAGVSERLIFFHFASKALVFEQAVVAPFNAFMNDFISEWRSYRDSPHDLEYVGRRWIGGMFDLLRQNRRLVLALLTANAYEEEFVNTLSDKRSPFAAVHQLTEEIMAVEAETRGIKGLDLSLTVRIPFAALLAAAVFDGPVFAGMGRRPSRDRIVEEMVAFAIYGSTAREA